MKGPAGGLSRRVGRLLAIGIGLALALACASPGRLVEVDAARKRALVAGDVATLSELFADGLRYGHANGVVHSKPELLERLASGELRYRAIRYETAEAREVAGAWVVSGRQTVEVVAGGREITSRSSFVAVYTHRRGRWRLVAYQSTPLPREAKPRGARRALRVPAPSDTIGPTVWACPTSPRPSPKRTPRFPRAWSR